MVAAVAEIVNPTCAWCGVWPCLCQPAVEVRCACGGTLRSRGSFEVAEVVREHNRRTEHVLWRRERGL